MKQLKTIIGILLVMVLMNIICSCASSNRMELKANETEHKIGDLSRMDSLVENSKFELTKRIEALKELLIQRNSEKTVVNYAPPDSTGKQYKTSEETIKENTTVQQKEQYNEQLEAQVTELKQAVSSLNQKVDELRSLNIDSKEQNKNLTDSMKGLVYALIVLIIISSILFIFFKYKNNHGTQTNR